MYLIKKVSEISGLSVRTLHHYDEIGLLSPMKNEKGYRYYSEEDMSVLQTIMFYKYLGFSLKKIKELLAQGDNELLPVLKKQLLLMQCEKQRLLTLIATLEKTIQAQERKDIMCTKEKFKGFTYQDNLKYRQAAMEMCGKEAIEKAEDKQKGKEQEIADGFNRIFFAFAKNMSDGVEAGNEENIKLSESLYRHICQYAFGCSPEVFSSIAYGYVQNEEFRNNLELFGAGTAQYVCDAVQHYISKK